MILDLHVVYRAHKGHLFDKIAHCGIAHCGRSQISSELDLIKSISLFHVVSNSGTLCFQRVFRHFSLFSMLSIYIVPFVLDLSRFVLILGSEYPTAESSSSRLRNNDVGFGSYSALIATFLFATSSVASSSGSGL